MANSTGTPQSMLYQMRGQNTAPSDGNGTRNRSVEQQHSYNSGNPMNYQQFLNGQDPSLGRYVPPTLQGTSPGGGNQWNNNQGGYAYNLPTSFGGFGGFSQYSQNPQGGFGGGPQFSPQAMQTMQQYNGAQGQSQLAAAQMSGGGYGTPAGSPNDLAKPGQITPIRPPVQGSRALPTAGRPPYRSNDLSYKQLVEMLSNSNQPRLSRSASPVGGSIGGPLPVGG